MSVTPSVTATTIYRLLSPEHRPRIVRGDRLSAEHPADNRIAETIVQMTMAQTTVLHVDKTDFMSRINKRRTRRMVASLENPRERPTTIWLAE